jgi:hypothetical protein
MSLVVVIFTALTLAITVMLVWLVGKRLPEESSLGLDSKIEDLVPLHTQHFPQLRQALDSTDSRYMKQKATGELRRQWREDRRRILRGFLTGLAEDFAKLDRLARTVASLSPKISRREELGRIWLNLRFRLNYRIVWIWLSTGGMGPVGRLSYLTSLLGDLSARAEAAMTRLEIRAS